jgi:hypothetical protein
MKLPKFIAALSIVATAVAAQSAPAQQTPVAAPATAPAAATASANAKTYALVSAVGDQFTYVRQRESTGSNRIDNFTRQVIKVPNNALNAAVLRGLDRAVASLDPDSNRVYVTLAPAEMENVSPQDREAVAIGKVVSALEKMPERAKWDKIYVAVPKFLLSERSGMGTKLHGLGVYIQPLSSATLSDNELGVDIDVGSSGESDSTNPEGEAVRSKRYVAPFSYISTYVIDPRTMRVIEKNNRHDFQKLFDPNSPALDVANSIPTDFLVSRIETLIERSAAKSVNDKEGPATVEVGEVKPVTGKPEPKK